MFLDHKTLYYDVEPFLFYIMTETDDAGARFVGYFSKEKRSPMEYNVSYVSPLLKFSHTFERPDMCLFAIQLHSDPSSPTKKGMGKSLDRFQSVIVSLFWPCINLYEARLTFVTQSLLYLGYLLSKKEGRVGSPEKPLSSLGLLSYTKYWTTAVFSFLQTAQRPVSIEGECFLQTSMDLHPPSDSARLFVHSQTSLPRRL